MTLRTAEKNISDRHGALLVAAITGAIYGLFAIAYLGSNEWDASIFVVAGTEYTDAREAPRALETLLDGLGYDGQFYYRMALNPQSTATTDHGVTLDLPAYRGRRILYPLTVWLFSWGNPQAALWAMVGVNFGALLGLGFVSGRLAARLGQHPLWGLAITLYPGILFGFARDLPGVMATLFLLWGVLLVFERRLFSAVASFTCAALTREVTLLVPVGLFGVSLLGAIRPGRDTNPIAWPLLIPAGVYTAWIFISAYRWGEAGYATAPDMISWPLGGIVAFFGNLVLEHPFHAALWSVEAILLILWVFLPAFQPAALRAHPEIAMAWMLNAALLLSLNVWTENWGFLRIATPTYCLAAIISFQVRQGLVARSWRLMACAWMGLTAYHLFAIPASTWFRARGGNPLEMIF